MKWRNEKGLVSVIMPTHNRSAMLRRAIESVLRQSYKNLEIIVIADHCTDDTTEVVTTFEDSRIIYMPVLETVGGAQARNFGLDIANGEFIAFLDDDDEWRPEKLETQLRMFEQHPDAAIVSCCFDTFDGSHDLPSKVRELVMLDDLYYQNYCGSFSFCVTKRDHVKDLKINPALKSHQDWDLWLKILKATGMTCRASRARLVRYYHAHEDKISKKHYQSFLAKVTFLRSHWDEMNVHHRNYALYELMKLKRLYCNSADGHFFRLRMYWKALKFYRQSGYNQKIYNYLLLLPKLIR